MIFNAKNYICISFALLLASCASFDPLAEKFEAHKKNGINIPLKTSEMFESFFDGFLNLLNQW